MKNCNPFFEEYPTCQNYLGKSVTLPIHEEARKTYRPINQNGRIFVKILTDECLLPKILAKKHKVNEIQARNLSKLFDALYLNCDENIAYFIETKDCKLSDAIEQLQKGIELLSPQILKFKFKFRVVQSNVVTKVKQQQTAILINFLKNKYKQNILDIKIEEIIKIESRELKEQV